MKLLLRQEQQDNGAGRSLELEGPQCHHLLKPLPGSQKMKGGSLSPIWGSVPLTELCFCVRGALTAPSRPSQIHFQERSMCTPKPQVQKPAEGFQACPAFVFFKSISLKKLHGL